MLYLSKFLTKIKENPTLFKSQETIVELGLSTTQIKDLKKYAQENELIKQEKQNFTLTRKGIDYLNKNPLTEWCSKEYPLRPNINLELLKENKTCSVLTRAIRNYAKYLLNAEEIKENSIEKALYNDINSCKRLTRILESEILSNKRICIDSIFNKYMENGLTKSLISLIILTIIANNLEKIAIYEKSQFQLNFDTLMFDRMIACPQNFEIQRTEMPDRYILKDISKIILNKKSDNILEITKGLYKIFKNLDKYTMNTENLSLNTKRLRNVILNAKDPISLFERDIPKTFSYENLENCERKFLDDFKNSLTELKNCKEKLLKDIRSFIFENFQTKSKEDLSERFLKIKSFVNNKELKILLNCITDINVSDDLWINRVATFINQSRVPKDWSDEDFANFKLKTKELSLKFTLIEATIGIYQTKTSKKYEKLIKEFLDLEKQEQLFFLRKAVNS